MTPHELVLSLSMELKCIENCKTRPMAKLLEISELMLKYRQLLIESDSIIAADIELAGILFFRILKRI